MRLQRESWYQRLPKGGTYPLFLGGCCHTKSLPSPQRTAAATKPNAQAAEKTQPLETTQKTEKSPFSLTAWLLAPFRWMYWLLDGFVKDMKQLCMQKPVQ